MALYVLYHLLPLTQLMTYFKRQTVAIFFKLKLVCVLFPDESAAGKTHEISRRTGLVEAEDKNTLSALLLVLF